ncbi:MAG TPA: EboA domain-containing protein, partial [Geminicoccaceae bacterium]|nr:EboA domain-containing protein [Geminicoccaceae bacterium]
TNVLDVFEAIACDNPYPATHFPEANFNQMVVKALFVGTLLARVRGLADRDTPELRRMVGDFASERRAAGRPVPEDAGLVLRS